MGGAVNGPGEATHTYLGIAFGKGAGHLYYKGEKRGRVKESKAIDELKDMISEFEAEKKEDCYEIFIISSSILIYPRYFTGG